MLPLIVNTAGSATKVGLVMAAFNLAGITAPLWGNLADRRRIHRLLLAGGLALTGVALFLFSRHDSVGWWIVMAFLLSVGSAAASTVANLFIVEAHPEGEWDQRIGWLQTFYGGGQVLGLLIAAAVTATSSMQDYSLGLAIGAGLALAGIIPGWLKTKTPPKPAKPMPLAIQEARHTEASFTSPARTHYHFSREGLAGLKSMIKSPFGLFLVGWLLATSFAAMWFALYPMLMQKLFSVHPSVSSTAYAVGAALAMALYEPAGAWGRKFGSLRVLQAGYLLRALAFAGLFALTVVRLGGADWVSLLVCVIVILSWSLISVASTALTVKLAPVGQGEAVGLYNAATAVAGTLGAALSGVLADNLGYAAVSFAAAAGILPALALTFLLRPEDKSAGTQPGPRASNYR
jgi:MFS family permease